MTVKELFEYVDEILENVYPDDVKLIWLNQIEAEIQVDVLLMAAEGITQYDETTYGAELIAPAPFDQLYQEYLFWRICLAQQEFEKANNYAATFNRAYNEYVRFVCETINPGNGLAERVRYYLTAYQIAVKHGYSGSELEWLESLQGTAGEPGAGLNIVGQVESEADLPTSGMEKGVGYLVGYGVGALLYIWNGSDWFYKTALSRKGDKGDPMKFEDLTDAQKAELKGEKGDPFTFDDFTPEQLEGLEGDTGPAGVYYGTEPPTDPSHPVWINPLGMEYAGGYYTPQVSQLDEETMRITFAPSKKEMPEVLPADVKLPEGPGGDPGTTPNIGDNGNWFIGETDTGMPSRGDDGESITIKKIEQVKEDSNSYQIVYFSDGTELSIFDGKNGDRGATGRGILWITANDDGTWEVTYSDNTTQTVTNDALKYAISDAASAATSARNAASRADAAANEARGKAALADQEAQNAREQANLAVLATDEALSVASKLREARDNGEFDGEPGTSVTVKSVTESTEDGGTNVVEFSDGTKLNVRNGSGGSAGEGADVTAENIEAALGYKPADEASVPTKTSDLNNDSGFITEYTETDPTVPAWAKAQTPPTYSKNDVGLGNVDNVKQYSASNPPPYPVTSVNGKTGAVTLGAENVGADPAGTAGTAVSNHNAATDSHNDIRLELKAINDRLTAFFDSDDTTLDELSEIVAYIQSNKSLIDAITTNKVSVSDIINNLTTNVANKPLSAAQGVVLKGLIDSLTTSLSNYQPKGDYALRSELPSVPVQSVNGKTGAVQLSADDVGARPSGWTPSASEVGADAAGSASSAVAAHNTDKEAHADIREELGQLSSEKLDKGLLFVSIPDSVDIKVGSEFRMYFRNVLSRSDVVLWVNSASGLTTKYYNDYLSIMPTTVGSYSLTWKVYDNASNELASGALAVNAVNVTATGETRVIVIGDSTVYQAGMTAKALELYETDEAVLTLYGTRGTAPNLTEGRAGWDAKKYCTTAADNPFYNSGFDFAYYMNNQNYEGVQAVVVQLGINDIFGFKAENYNSAEALGYIGQIVSSILAYDSTICVIVNLPTTPNSNGTDFTEEYGTSQLYWVYNRNIIRFAEELQAQFTNNGRVIVSASNCVIDTKTGINDGVHPNTSGYNALGQRLYEALIANVTGVEIPSSSELWDVASRTAVVNSYAPATSARTMSNACYYYPAAYTGAWANAAGYDVSNVSIGSNSLSFQCAQNAFGIFIPFLGLDTSKTYRFTVNPKVEGFRVYLVNYDNTGVYVNNQIVVDKTTGLTTFDFTPNANYQQGFCFACLSGTKNVLGTFTDLSLTEVTE